MCLIVYKKQGVDISDNDLSDMWTSNPDGAGLMFLRDSKVVIHKGFMSLNSLKRVIKRYEHYDLTIHFRYATHGRVNQNQCHPFPVNRDFKDMFKTSLTCDIGVVHNGILGGYGNEHYSDTIDFISLLDGNIDQISDDLYNTGSKYILMNKSKIIFIGNFEEYKGFEVSNTYWSYPSKWDNDILTTWDDIKEEGSKYE